MVPSGLLRRQIEMTLWIKSRMELEVDLVQIIFGEVCMNTIALEARLIATCYFGNPEEVAITADGNYCQVLGSAEDFQFLPLYADVKEAIFQRLQEGYNMRSVRFALHRAFRSQNEAAVFEKAYRRHDDQKASVKLWLNHLESKNYNVYIDNGYDSSFTFEFCSS
ncbi:hypothetical protein BCV72DRAFT_303285 [Rhizopus microsporus var. microsporus]|uniref:Uncharacterized protein n=2 Tax=Rhizopus microsporus TaxID=58291 RepID=A0A2G4SRH6_RHIZD|nr:uncharacterized protein RHIMIDRAFT_238807 [Rhizopus microsporus ATCC 52813]ORE08907.1 hypothetical protein BCV72DRAFT_303285 [Rhizopus microsporus var. microsporus]PHZ11373.1 hypothetical protein RHIMIDRAFT_238807 [Rhizopus microsporus ATCC 52813]